MSPSLSTTTSAALLLRLPTLSTMSTATTTTAAAAGQTVLRRLLTVCASSSSSSSVVIPHQHSQQLHQQQRRWLISSTDGRPRISSLAELSMHANLEEKFSRFPLPKESLQFRLAAPADKAEVLRIEPEVHYGLDYMQDYYEDIVSHESRCGLVAVDTANKKILTFVYAIVNDGGRNLSFGGGRTIAGYRDYGLMSLASRALFEHLQPRLHSLAGCCGVYNLPVYTRRFFENRRSLLKVVLHNHQLGFECTADYLASLAQRFAANTQPPSSGSSAEPTLVANPVEFLASSAVCSGTENCLFKPDQHLLIAKESLIFSRGNLLIWQRYLEQVMASHTDSGDVAGVSIANWTSVPIGGLHLVLNIYCRTEACAVSHLTAQLAAAIQRLHLQDPSRDRLYISAYIPSHLVYNEVLCGIRVHRVLRDLPQSYSPKLACDMRIGAWAPGGYI